MILFLSLVNIALGFLGHLSKRVTTDHVIQEWRVLCNYGLGVIYVYPLAQIIHDQLISEIPSHRLRFAVTYFLSFCTFGLGVLAGRRYIKMG